MQLKSPIQWDGNWNRNWKKRSIILVMIVWMVCPMPLVGQVAVAVAVLVAGWAWGGQPHQVYMIDFECYKPPSTWRVPHATFMEHIRTMGIFEEKSVVSMERMLAGSGQGERTSLPPSLFFIPPRPYHKESLQEARMLLFAPVEALLCRARMSPKDVDILIVNCSGACPSPSLSDMIVNRFRMRVDVKAFTLSGMGCSASMIAVHMAANLLKVQKKSNALIVSTEILSNGWYTGKEENKLALNCVFRSGSAAILLTNSTQQKPKYKLILSQRKQIAHDDRAYHSAFREEDEQGITGVTLNPNIVQIASEAVRTTVSDLAKRVLPWSEKMKYCTSKGLYVPEMKTVIAHFCVPTSGRRFITEMSKGLRLDQDDIEAAMATLHRFGNLSSAGLWYELAYLEAKGRVKEGDKVWQLGMGSGVKTTTLLWESIFTHTNMLGPWDDCIHNYPDLLPLHHQ